MAFIDHVKLAAYSHQMFAEGLLPAALRKAQRAGI